VVGDLAAEALRTSGQRLASVRTASVMGSPRDVPFDECKDFPA